MGHSILTRRVEMSCSPRSHFGLASISLARSVGRLIFQTVVTHFQKEIMSEFPNTETGPDFSHGDGLVPAIAQDFRSGDVLMMAYMNSESFAETVATSRAVYYSRSRKRLWRKGEESGNVQIVKSIYVDCDRDTILLKVEQIGGAACHEGYSSCFFRRVTPEGLQVEGQRIFDPAVVYKK
jgi:phosphoribosyl-AMP cyclohydrolase